MEQKTLDTLTELVRNRYFGKYRGVVADNEDPTNRGRIKVRVPAVMDSLELWAMPCVPYAGDNVGTYIMPEVDDGVWVEFEAGDPSYPIWTGCFWSDGELPKDHNDSEATPSLKTIRSKQGLMVTMDDEGQEIHIADSNGNNIITIEVQPGKIFIKGASKAVVEAPQIELVENATHPVVFGDNLIQYLNQVAAVFQSHIHPGEMALGVFPITPAPPAAPFPPATPALHSQRVTTG